MTPKSYKEFKKNIADEVNVHPQVVDDFITFYYAKVRKKLSQLDFPRIYIDGLGTFELRKNKVEETERKHLLESFIKYNDQQDKFRGKTTWRKLIPELENSITKYLSQS